ncbi:unnamed protein product [Nippostrongylus brasiliensis]|uniref:Variable large protein n=1 Tax=Nippostrongylus brasiliensis TaxID=27835 RepID=A0A0N4XNQ0_NIPBR|nr:unnamed protein product [Nippostrongylus brasiliensis]
MAMLDQHLQALGEQLARTMDKAKHVADPGKRENGVMKIVFLTLILAVVVHGGFFDDFRKKVEGAFGGDGRFFQRLKNATIVGAKKLANSATLAKIHEKLNSVKDKMVKVLKLSPSVLRSLRERLKVTARSLP